MSKNKKKQKALILFSGGLDSILSAKILIEQGIEVDAIAFKSYFFNADRAIESAKEIGIKLKIVDISEEQLKLVREPKKGYGSALNPCIDCHSLMIETARKEKGYDIIATGEVLNQRPFSQNKNVFGINKDILRPLSANLLPGDWGDLKFYSINSKSRKEQIELAKKFNIKEYPQPAGGCVLTEKGFCKKLKDILHRKITKNDIDLLKIGRHFFIKDTKIVISRNGKEENEIIKLKRKNDILLRMKNYKGALAMIRFYDKKDDKAIDYAKKLIEKYSHQKKDNIIYEELG